MRGEALTFPSLRPRRLKVRYKRKPKSMNISPAFLITNSSDGDEWSACMVFDSSFVGMMTSPMCSQFGKSSSFSVPLHFFSFLFLCSVFILFFSRDRVNCRSNLYSQFFFCSTHISVSFSLSPPPPPSPTTQSPTQSPYRYNPPISTYIPSRQSPPPFL